MLSAGHPELAHGMGALAAHRFGHSLSLFSGWIGHQGFRRGRLTSPVTVSYTHLTLPTNREV